MNAITLASRPGIAERVPGSARKHVPLLKRLAIWRRVAQERRHLRDFDDHMLADMGMTREQAQAEGARPFWDVNPAHFR